MEQKNIIILVLVIIIVALLAGMIIMMPNFSKSDVNLEIVSNATLGEGDQIDVKLSDSNKTPIANETINITITDENQTSSYYSAVTNEEGIASLKLDKSVGNYTVNCSYNGNDKYNGNAISQKLTVSGEVQSQSTSSSSSGSSGPSSSSSSSSSDDYVYSPQGDKYIKKSGQYDSDGRGNTIYSYQGGDGVIYQRYYDSNGKEISANDYYK